MSSTRNATAEMWSIALKLAAIAVVFIFTVCLTAALAYNICWICDVTLLSVYRLHWDI